MRFLAVKEITAITQLITAILSLFVVLALAYVIRFPNDMKLFALQCVLTATMVICVIFAFSTWFYNSNYALTRVHVRTFCVIVLWILFICIIVTGYCLHDKYGGELIGKYFEKDIFSDFDMLLMKISIFMTYAIGIIMFIMNLVLTIILILKWLKRRKK